ncbi:hypothetical protein GGI22_003900, partial [Coemansia erecta]
LQLYCDVVRAYTSYLFRESSDDHIESIDYNDVDSFYRSNPMPTTEIDPDIGVYAALNINVRDVHIDKNKLAGFGLGEDSLRTLIEEDEQAAEKDVADSKPSCGRLVPFELVVAWSACEGHNDISRTGDYSRAVDPKPLFDDEK